MKKYICPHCKADLKKVGIRNSQEGTKWWNCEIINNKGEMGNWEEDDFDARDSGYFYCGDCIEELNLKVLRLTI